MADGDFKDFPRRAIAAIKYYVIKHLLLLKIPNMMNINGECLHWSITF